MVRENLERINETSLAANIQELSFRLLPMGLAAGAATSKGIDTAQTIEEIRLNFTAFTGDQAKAVELMTSLTEQARRFGLPMLETLGVMQRFAPLIRQAGLELDDVMNIAVRLATLNPSQGIEGALFALNEALAGQWRSIQTRFNIPTSQLKELIDTKGFIGGLDEFLNKLGRTTELAEQFGETSRASFTKLEDSIKSFLASTMDPFLGSITDLVDRGTDAFNNFAENGNNALSTMVGGLLLLTTTLSSTLLAVGQFALGWNAIMALLPANTASAVRSATGSLVSGAARMAGAATAVGAGAYVGVRAAAALGVGGTNDPNEQADRLIQILAAVPAGLATAFL